MDPKFLKQLLTCPKGQGDGGNTVHVFINSELKLNRISQVQDFSKTDLSLRSLGDWVISLYVDK